MARHITCSCREVIWPRPSKGLGMIGFMAPVRGSFCQKVPDRARGRGRARPGQCRVSSAIHDAPDDRRAFDQHRRATAYAQPALAKAAWHLMRARMIAAKPISPK